MLLGIAAVAGDSLNYSIGYAVGPKVFSQRDTRFFKKEYLDRTHAFYERHGGKTIIIARFMPIIRTFAPVRRRHRQHDLPALPRLQRRRRRRAGSACSSSAATSSATSRW